MTDTGTSGIDAKVAEVRGRVRLAMADAFSPLVNWLDQRHISANQLSWLGFGLAILAGLLAGFEIFTVAGIIYLIVGMVDVLDGALARRNNSASGAGAFLDSLLDRAGEGVIHAGAAVAFAYWGMWGGVLAVVLSLTGGYLTSYARACAEGLGIELPEVWFGRGERLILLSLGLIFHFAVVAFWLLTILCWVSAAHRTWLAWCRLAPTSVADEAKEASSEVGEESDASGQSEKDSTG